MQAEPAAAAVDRRLAAAYFCLGMGAFLALYLPQPLLPQLDHDLSTPPALTALVMTAGLLGFAVAGLLPDRRPQRTLRLALGLTVVASLLASASPSVWVLIAARAGQGLGIGLLIAGGLADIPRRLPRSLSGRVTGLVIAGTAMGGLLGRLIGYTGLFISWRGAFLVGAAGVLAAVLPSLRQLPPVTAEPVSATTAAQPRAPLSLLVAGAGILFVSVGMFDTVPYRLAGPPFSLPATHADLVYMVFIGATAVAFIAGRALDRLGPRRLTLLGAAIGIAMILVGLLPSLAAVTVAALGAICGAVGLHVSHSATAAGYGRAAVGRYLAGYYVGGAAAAPLIAATYQRWGWPGVILPLCASWLVVAALAATRKDADSTEREPAERHVAPAGPLG